MSNIVQVKVPDIGDFDAVEVIEVLVAEGDTIAPEQSLITVESDKASMEIPSEVAGVVKALKVKVGDQISEGSVILEIEESASGDGEAAADAASSAAPAREAAPSTAESAADDAPAESSASSEPARSEPGASRDEPVVVPDIGDFDTVEVIEVLVAEGDEISAEQSLITVESDKASMEIPSPVAGVVRKLGVKVGDQVSQGSEILVVSTTADAGASTASAPEASAATPSGDTPAAAPRDEAPAKAGEGAVEVAAVPAAAVAEPARDTDSAARDLPHASPSVRKFARELGVDLRRVQGSGRKGRITADDVRAYVKQTVQAGGDTSSAGLMQGVLAWPEVDFSKFGEIETRALSRIKKISGANLHRNWVMIPHVTNNDVADITELEALRKTLNAEAGESGTRVTILAFLIRAVVAALKKYPEFNSSLDGDNLVYKQYYHIGFAADTPNGLVVPVIRDVDQKGILQIASETADLARQARDGKLSPSQMQGGCFTISSLGGIGGTDFTPIINAPEVAILGVSRAAMQPVWNGKKFRPRLMLPLSLSYDHRVIDGAAAARFNAYLASLLADFRRITL